MLIGPAEALSPKNSFTQQNQPPVYSSQLRSASFQHCDHSFDLPMNHVTSGGGGGTGGGYPPSPCSLRSRKQCSDCSLGGLNLPTTNEGPPSFFSHHHLLGTANGPLSRVNSTSQGDLKTVTQNSMLGKPLFDALRNKDGADISLIRNSHEFQQPTRNRQQRRRRGKHVPRTRNIDVSRIDLYSRIMFPLTYIMICLVYWMVYLGVTDLQDKTKEPSKHPKTNPGV